MSLMLISFLLVLFVLALVAAAVIMMGDPERIDKEERRRIERQWRYRRR